MCKCRKQRARHQGDGKQASEDLSNKTNNYLLRDSCDLSAGVAATSRTAFHAGRRLELLKSPGLIMLISIDI